VSRSEIAPCGCKVAAPGARHECRPVPTPWNPSRTLDRNLPPRQSCHSGTCRAFSLLPHDLHASCLSTIAMSSDFGICNSNDPEQLKQAFGKLGLFLNRPEPCIICIACQYALHPSAEAVSKHLWSVHETPPAARKGLNRVVKTLRFPNPNTSPVRHDGSTPHSHLSIAERFKVPLFELMKVWAAALKQMSSVSIILFSQTFVCVISFYPFQSICYLPFPHTFSYFIPPCGIPGCSHYLHGTVPRFLAAQSGSLPIMFLESQLGISLHPCLAHYLLW